MHNFFRVLMMRFSLHLILCLSILVVNHHCFTSLEENQKWSYFVFAQQWPPAACLEVPHGKCEIADVVTEWTVHGLWPTSHKGYPSFCNDSWPFDPKSIKKLKLSLEAKWPNIYADSSEIVFWKHEWAKHGTCAASEELFNSEYNYFKRSLELHDKFNIFEFLRKAGIVADSEKPILLKYVENAITHQVNRTIKLFCKNHEEYKYPVLTSMYICLNKQLGLIDCDEIHEPTCEQPYLMYLPFEYEKEHNYTKNFV